MYRHSLSELKCSKERWLLEQPYRCWKLGQILSQKNCLQITEKKKVKKELERIRGEDDPMTRNEKKKVIEQMAEKFTRIDDLEEKTMIVMIMSAYAEGKAAGKAEERRKWEEKKNKICN